MSFTLIPRPERWKDIPGWEGYYEVSDWGRARSVDRIIIRSDGKTRRFRGKNLNPCVHDCGYQQISLRRGEIRVPKAYVHRLVMLAFVGPCPEGMEVCHNNDDPEDNRLANLRYGTHAENIGDIVRHHRHNNQVKKVCKFGHSLEGRNVYPLDLSQGRRKCVACHRARGYLTNHPELRSKYQEISDSYFESINSEVVQ